MAGRDYRSSSFPDPPLERQTYRRHPTYGGLGVQLTRGARGNGTHLSKRQLSAIEPITRVGIYLLVKSARQHRMDRCPAPQGPIMSISRASPGTIDTVSASRRNQHHRAPRTAPIHARRAQPPDFPIQILPPLGTFRSCPNGTPLPYSKAADAYLKLVARR